MTESEGPVPAARPPATSTPDQALPAASPPDAALPATRMVVALAFEANTYSVRKFLAPSIGAIVLCLYFMILSPPSKPMTLFDCNFVLLIVGGSMLGFWFDHRNEAEARRLLKDARAISLQELGG